jgi:AAA+ superfamily predicted ATPase
LETLANNENKKLSLYVTIYGCYSSQLTNLSSINIRKHKILNNDIFNDYKKYLDAFIKYTNQSVLFNNNTLLYGPPGVGKTRFVLDIAVYLNFNIYKLDVVKGSISSCSKNNNCIFLIEEIDKILNLDGTFDSRYSDKVGEILEFLDGISRPISTMIIITTNNYKVVMSNKVLSRPGRINRKIKFGYLSYEQCEHVLMMYYPELTAKQMRYFFDNIPDVSKVTIAMVSSFVQYLASNCVEFDDIKYSEISIFSDEKDDTNLSMYA